MIKYNVGHLRQDFMRLQYTGGEAFNENEGPVEARNDSKIVQPSLERRYLILFMARGIQTHLHVLHPVFTWNPPVLARFMITNVPGERHFWEIVPASRISSPSPFNLTVHCEKKKNYLPSTPTRISMLLKLAALSTAQDKCAAPLPVLRHRPPLFVISCFVTRLISLL